MFPFPEANLFYQMFCCIAALFACLLLGMQVWRSLFPRKTHDDEPVTRGEFAALSEKIGEIAERLAALSEGMEARQDQFNATLSAILKTNESNIARLHDRVLRLENRTAA